MPIASLSGEDRARLNEVEHLYLSEHTYQLQMELTTYCNLRCIYCSTISPNHKKLNLDLANFSKYMDELQLRKLKTISLCGAGELTLLNNWVGYCNDIIKRGIDLQVTSNLARELNDDEADTLSRCSYVNVSVDSVDPKMYREFRKGGDLRALLFNMSKIRARAFLRRQLPPSFAWYTVVTDRNVFQMKELVNFGLSFGIRTFHFCNFAKHDLEESKDLYPVSMMPVEQLRQLPDYLAELFKLIEDGGGWHLADAGLVDGVKERLAALDRAAANGTAPEAVPASCCGGTCEKSAEQNGSNAAAPAELPSAPMAAIGGARANAPTYSGPASAPGMTRDCVLPWTYAQVMADGNVRPCCIIPTVGKLEDGKTIASVINNQTMTNIRKGLIDGKPIGHCYGCPQVAWIPKEELRKKVEDIVNGGDLPLLKKRQEFVDLQYDPLQLRTEYDRMLAEHRKLEHDHVILEYEHRHLLGSPRRLAKRWLKASWFHFCRLFKRG